MTIPVHEWLLDAASGVLADTGSVGGYPGTDNGMAVVDPSPLGRGRKADATSDYIAVGNPPAMRVTTGDFTIVILARILSSIGAYNPLVYKWISAGNQRGYVTGVKPTGELYFWQSSDGSTAGYKTETTDVIADDQYHLLAFRREDEVAYILVDGVLVVSGVAPASIYLSTADAEIGNDGSGHTTGSTSTEFDHVQFFAEAITDAELRSLTYKALSTISLENLTPDRGAINVGTDTPIQIGFRDSAHDIDYTAVTVDLGSVSVYDGSGAATPADGIQSGFPGTMIGDGSGGYDLNVQPTDELYETYLYNLAVHAENDNGDVYEENWNFDTEQKGQIKNSGFEAEGAGAGQARYWNESGMSGGDMGVKRGRVLASTMPTFVTSEGERIFLLGSVNDADVINDGHDFAHKLGQEQVDATGQTIWSHPYLTRVDSDLSGTKQVRFQALIDGVVVWEQVAEAADAGDETVGTMAIDITSYTGLVDIEFKLIRGEFAFDEDTEVYEDFDELLQTIPYDNDAATEQTFDGGQEDWETFERWQP